MPMQQKVSVMASKTSQGPYPGGYLPLSELIFAATNPMQITMPYEIPMQHPPLPGEPRIWNRNIDYPSLGIIYSQPRTTRQA